LVSLRPNLRWDSATVSFSMRSREQKDPIDANSSEFLRWDEQSSDLKYFRAKR